MTFKSEMKYRFFADNGLHDINEVFIGTGAKFGTIFESSQFPVTFSLITQIRR